MSSRLESYKSETQRLDHGGHRGTRGKPRDGSRSVRVYGCESWFILSDLELSVEFQRIEEVAGGNHGGLAGEHFIHQAGVDFRILIGAAVFDYDEAVVCVGGV